MEAQCKSISGVGRGGGMGKQGYDRERAEYRRDAERKGWERQVCRGVCGAAQREVLTSQATQEGDQASEGRTSHP